MWVVMDRVRTEQGIIGRVRDMKAWKTTEYFDNMQWTKLIYKNIEKWWWMESEEDWSKLGKDW